MKRNYIFKMDLLILAILVRKDCYGYELAAQILEESKQTIVLKEGIMYPILHRLMDEGMISSYEKVVNRKIRVYYHIEKKGIDEFQFMKNDFEIKCEFIHKIINGEEE